MAKVLLLLADGFEEIEAVTAIDILRRAHITVQTVAITSPSHVKDVKGAHDIIVQADTCLDDVSVHDVDMLVLPGGLDGTTALMQHPQVIELLKAFNAANKWIAAICAAPLVLDTAGVLKNPYTCFAGIERKIACAGYTDAQSVVMTENIVTAKGPASALRFALTLVSILATQTVYEQVKNSLLLD